MEACQRDMRKSDHYILILGQRYGSRRAVHGAKSVTELEYEAAPPPRPWKMTPWAISWLGWADPPRGSWVSAWIGPRHHEQL